MSCGHFATRLDVEMLLAQGVTVAGSHIPDSELPEKTGIQVAKELAGRPLIRYIRREDVLRFVFGDENRQCTTPTPYSVDDLIGFLNLPDPLSARTHCLLLNPVKIPVILGPRYIAWGSGIEYILPEGFEQEDLMYEWALEVR